MKILVMGHKGMLGSDLMAVLGRDHEVSGVDVGEFDITSAEDCLRVIGEFNPAVVINAAAYTDVDGCETNRDACFAVNAEGVRNVALACRDRGAKVVHYSTDYVFDGTKMEPYLEDDPCRPINAYGASKRKGEEHLIETVENHVLIRTAWLYGRQGKNFVKAILAKAREEGVLRVVRKLLHPAAQLRLMHTKIDRCLCVGNASILDQAHSLKLELSRELPPLHDSPPVPSKHLTRCLRNRVQANGHIPE